MSNQKSNPDEVLERLGRPAEGRYGSWHTELVEALRDAIAQRDALREALEMIEAGFHDPRERARDALRE